MTAEYCPGEPDSWTWPDAYGVDEMIERFTGFTLTNPKATAQDAAKRFADSWDIPRRIARWDGSRFQLVDSVGWYELRPCPDGWQVWRIDP